MAQQTLTLNTDKSLDVYILFKYNSLVKINDNISKFITDITAKYTNVRILTPENWFSAPLESFIINIGIEGTNSVPEEIFKYCSNYQFGSISKTRTTNTNLLEITINTYGNGRI